MEKVTITMPEGLSKKARDAGINISRTATKAVEEAILKLKSDK